MSFPAAPTFPVRFKRPIASTFPSAPTFPPPASVLPTPPVPGPSLWLRGDDAPNSASPGTSVALWPDVSGNGNDATQATVSSQPTGLSNQINGHAAVVGDAIDDFLAVAFLTTVNRTIFIAHQYVSSQDALLDDYTINTGALSYRQSSGALIGLYSGGPDLNVTTSSPVSAAPIVLTYIFNGASSSIFINGALGVVGDAGTPKTNGITIFSRAGGTSNIGAKIYEILIYSSVLSDANRQTVQAYLGAKYAIQLGLPQISLFDFSLLNGASFVTGGAGLYVTLQAHNGPTDLVLWFNTGTETEPSLGSFVYIPIGCSPLDSAQGIANAFATAMTAALAGSLTTIVVDGSSGPGSLTAGQVTDKQSGPVASATAGNSGVAVSVTQSGQNNE